MTIKKDSSGKWLVHIYRKGMPRVRKTFDSKLEAQVYEHSYLKSHSPAEKINQQATDTRTIIDLLPLWYKYHGINLADGLRRHQLMERQAFALKNPIGNQLTAEQYVEYRYQQLESGLSPKTCNNYQKYLSAMYSKLYKLGVIDYPSPLANIDLIKVHERQLSYLSKSQIEAVFNAITTGCKNTSVWYVSQLCIRTGARWGEAENLRFKQLRDGLVIYEFTKSKKTRAIPIEPSFYKQLMDFAAFKNPEDRIFKNCYGSFRKAVKRSKIYLPRGQCSHILRHTFASYFVMNGGNIVSLQKILGHSDIAMTMRYAHLSPDHFQDAIKYNPMAVIGCEDS